MPCVTHFLKIKCLQKPQLKFSKLITVILSPFHHKYCRYKRKNLMKFIMIFLTTLHFFPLLILHLIYLPIHLTHQCWFNYMERLNMLAKWIDMPTIEFYWVQTRKERIWVSWWGDTERKRRLYSNFHKAMWVASYLVYVKTNKYFSINSRILYAIYTNAGCWLIITRNLLFSIKMLDQIVINLKMIYYIDRQIILVPSIVPWQKSFVLFILL